MKRTIKVMNKKPEITDEEIRSYMNFEKLVVQEKSLANRTLFRNGAVLLVGAVMVTGLWLFDGESKKDAVQKPAEEKIQEPVNEVPSKQPTDSILVSTEPEQKKKSEEKSQPQIKTPEKSIATENSSNKNSDSIVTEKQGALTTVYIQAEPVDGYPALYEYFARELTYPAESLKDSIQGVVTVAFTINAMGKPEKISIEQSLGSAFDKEAIRVITNMPLWKPAFYNNKPMASRMSVPLSFQIKKTQTH